MEIKSKEQIKKIKQMNKIFLDLDEGEYKIRILQNPHIIYEHKVDIDGKTKFIICPTEMSRLANEEELAPCPLCEQGNKPAIRYLTVALVRYDSDKFEVGILNKNSIIKKALDLNFDPDFGDVKEYDLKVKATGQKLQRRYEVNPMPKEKSLAINEEEQKVIDSFYSKNALEDFTKPKSYEVIQKIINGEDIPF